MSIVQLLEIQGLILAINDLGWLILWDLTQIKSYNGAYLFENNVSLLPPRGTFKIDPSSLQGLANVGDLIIIHSKDTIYISNLQQINASMKEQRAKGINTVPLNNFLDKKQNINCLVCCSQDLLLVGTNKGVIFTFNFKDNKIVHKINFMNQSKNEVNQNLCFGTIQKQNIQIRSITLYSNKNLALVGLSTGKIYSIQIETFEIASELSNNSKQNFESIEKIVMSSDQQRIFCLHQSYITQWNIKLSSCLSYYQYSHPRDLIILKDNLLIIGYHSQLLWLDEVPKEISLSMRSARVIKQISHDMLAVGGSDGLIDIFIGSMRLMTIYHT